LQDNKEKKDFSKACKHEIELYESEISKDYRLNFRLNKNCQKDVQNLCANVCGSSDGNVRGTLCGINYPL
jgi:Golgi apparatus protein 1